MTEKVDTKALFHSLGKLMDILGDLDAAPDVYEWASQHIDDPVRRMICERDGHRVVDDQCLMPAHRFCIVCEEIMADEPVKGAW